VLAVGGGGRGGNPMDGGRGAWGRDGRSRLAMDGRGGRGCRGGAVFLHVLADDGIHASAEMTLLEALADAEDVPERKAVGSEPPGRGARSVSAVSHAFEDGLDETILRSRAIDASAAALPALPGLCGRGSASPKALLAVFGLGTGRVAREARWAWATAATAAAFTL
jgi:hypothetical protein